MVGTPPSAAGWAGVFPPETKGRLQNENGPFLPKLHRIYPKQGFLPLFARLERQLSLPLRLRFPILLPFDFSI